MPCYIIDMELFLGVYGVERVWGGGGELPILVFRSVRDSLVCVLYGVEGGGEGYALTILQEATRTPMSDFPRQMNSIPRQNIFSKYIWNSICLWVYIRAKRYHT